MLGLSLVAACGRDSNNGNGGTPDAGGGGNPDGGGSGSDGGVIGGGVVHIQDIQSDSMPVKTPVELHGVVVVAIDAFGNKIGQDMWVEEVGGGVRSGIHVFRPPAAQIATLKPGDIIDIKGGVKSEFPTPTTPVTPSTTSVTELQAPQGGQLTITKTGTGAVPDAHLLDAAALDAMTPAARAVFMEDWEGVYVKLTNVRPAGAPTSFNMTSPGPDTLSFDITSGLTVESNLSAFPTSLDNSVCLASVTGVVDYVAGKYVVYPTKDGEIVTGGTSCPAPTVFTPSTVAEIQNGTHTGNVKLTGVFVTAVSVSGGKPGRTIWVSDALTAAPGTGLEVFSAKTIDAGAQVVGATVDITGTIMEFGTAPNTVTEFMNGSAVVTVKAAPGANLPVPVTATVDQVGVLEDPTSETYEGSLVQIAGLKVQTIGDHNQVVLVDGNNKTITMDDDVFFAYGGTTAMPTLPAVGTCYSTVTGVMDVQTTANVRTINPRTADDLPVVTCP
ncbi:MAG TPA: hypothetical protein VFP84_02895 [Kofleriaceae bacterium]|nr:hypothetical protein [Kofleriaceae bacterium]